MERIYSADDLQLLYIGRQTDNDLPKRYIDVGPYVEMYPGAHFDIVVFRPDEDVSYFADAALEGRTLIWTIHDGDVAVPGRGRAHIIISEGAGRHNLHDFITEIGETDQAEMVEVPDPAEGWVKRVIDAKNAANTAANAALQAVISADQSAQDAADALNELKDRIESGDFKGEPGDPGKDGTTPVKGVDYFTAEEQDAFKRAVTPVKGVDYRDGRDGIDGKDGLNGRDGRDGIDATPYDDSEIRDAVADLKGDIAQQDRVVGTKLDKSALLDSGIKSIDWNVVRSEISVTTVEDPYKTQRPSGTSVRYWKEFDGCPYFKNQQLYRVTFDGNVYDNLVCRYGILIDRGVGTVHGTKDDIGGCWQLIGNPNLYDSRYESTGEPFCILYIEHSGMADGGEYYYGHIVGHGVLFTESASTVTLKIERANITLKDLPKNLFNNYGFSDDVFQRYGESTYCRTSIGSANIVGRGGYAIGNNNISTGQFAVANGNANKTSGWGSHASGYDNDVSGQTSIALGRQNNVSCPTSMAVGQSNNVSGDGYNVAVGYNNTVRGYAAYA